MEGGEKYLKSLFKLPQTNTDATGKHRALPKHTILNCNILNILATQTIPFFNIKFIYSELIFL